MQYTLASPVRATINHRRARMYAHIVLPDRYLRMAITAPLALDVPSAASTETVPL